MNDDLREILLSAVLAVVAGSVTVVAMVRLLPEDWFLLFYGTMATVLMGIGFSVVTFLNIRTVRFCLGVFLVSIPIFAYMAQQGPVVFLLSWFVPSTICLGAVVAAVLPKWGSDDTATKDQSGTE